MRSSEQCHSVEPAKATFIMAEAQVPAGDNLQAAQAVAVQPPAPDNPADKPVHAAQRQRSRYHIRGLFHYIFYFTIFFTSSPVLHVFDRFNSYCVLCDVYSLLNVLRTVYISFTVCL
jgi:hypothetical protein